MTARKKQQSKPKRTSRRAGRDRGSSLKSERIILGARSSGQDDGRLTQKAIRAGLRVLGGWKHKVKAKQIERLYVFPSFVAAVRFVAYVAELAEAADHHPDIDIRYNKVRLALSTHSARGITAKDLDLARQIDNR